MKNAISRIGGGWWQTKKLGDVCDIKTGKKDVNEGNPTGRYPFFTCAREHTFSDSYSFDVEALLVAGNGDVGHVNYYKGKFEAYQRTYVLSGFKNVLPNFLFIFLDGFLKETVSKQKLGNTMPYIKMGMLTDFPVPVPSLPEQHRIVTILDEAFDDIASAKANAEKNLQNARALFESHLQAIFSRRGEGWVEKSLEELGTITSSKRIFKNEYVKSGVPFYRTKEIKELANGREITTELFISEARYKEIKKNFGVPKKGDILLTAIGTIGEIWVVVGENDFYFKDGNVLWLKEFASINPRFLKYVLMSFVESLNKMAHGSAYSALPIQRLNAHRIFLPSPEEQEKIVAKLDSLSEETQHLESIYQQKLAALEALKKSLLHHAFSGEL